MKTGRKNNNSGFSLVELVIVIAIMAVLVGVMATSITSLTGRKVRKCADEIVTTLESADPRKRTESGGVRYQL